MARQEANEQFQLTSFLDGANASYIEQLYARYETDPSSVSGEWQSFFKALADNPEDVVKAAKGASWKKAHWPATPRDELTSALDGDWGTVEKVVEKRSRRRPRKRQPPPALPPLRKTSTRQRAIRSAPSC